MLAEIPEVRPKLVAIFKEDEIVRYVEWLVRESEHQPEILEPVKAEMEKNSIPYNSTSDIIRFAVQTIMDGFKEVEGLDAVLVEKDGRIKEFKVENYVKNHVK